MSNETGPKPPYTKEQEAGIRLSFNSVTQGKIHLTDDLLEITEGIKVIPLGNEAVSSGIQNI